MIVSGHKKGAISTMRQLLPSNLDNSVSQPAKKNASIFKKVLFVLYSSATFSIWSPLVGHAASPLGENNPTSLLTTEDMPLALPISALSSSIAVAGNDATFPPATLSSNSANAARLLLDTPGGGSSLLPSRRVRNELAQQRAFQDSRLAQCQDNGKDWERCFFYGTTSSANPLTEELPFSTTRTATTPSRDSSGISTPFSSQSSGASRKNSKIPTW